MNKAVLHPSLLLVLATAPAFDASVPTPASSLGFEPGERLASPAQIVTYFEALAASTPRAKLKVMGRTHEGRPLIVLTVSSEKNLARSDKVAAEFRRLSDPRQVRSNRAAANALKDLPAVAWMGYSIHGNEVSGADAAMVVAYRLAAGTDAQTQQWRDNLIVYIDPLQNPDGRQRAVGTYEQKKSAVPDLDTSSLSNAETWPSGRGNHYLFDLNRDWFTLVHPESRARVPLIADVLPQLQIDAHEMGSSSTYLFSPARAPFNPHRPAGMHRWEQRFAQDQARAFDQKGWSYFTREWNEEFFPGYGSSWSSYLGAIGILYEQARSMGITVRQPAGTLLTYPESVARQVASSYANIGTLAENRTAIMQSWLTSRRDAARPGGASTIKAYVVRADRYPHRARTLVETLLLQNIEVMKADGPVRIADGADIFGRRVAQPLPADTLMVRLDQPNSRLIRNLFDFHLPMEADFLREQRRYLEKGKGSRLYETTAWSLGHAYGLETYWTRTVPTGRWSAVSAAPEIKGKVEGKAGYGYLFEGTTDAAVTLAARLMAQGIGLRVSRAATTIEGRTFKAGSVLIKNEGNPAETGRTLQTLAVPLGISVYGVSTGLASQGTDLGGANFEPLVAPRVGLLAGEPIRSDAYGFIWHLLDQRAGIRLSRLNIAWLRYTDLRRYNVLIVPRSWNSEVYRAYLDPSVLKRLKQWVQDGGTLIAIGEGADVIASPDAKMTSSRFRRHVLDKYPPVVFGLDPDVASRAGRFRAVGLRATPPPSKNGTPKSAGWADVRRPYHVPPVIGPGARPFLTSSPAPFAWPQRRQTLDKWAAQSAPGGKEAKTAYLKTADARLRRFLPSGVYLAADVDDDHWLTYGVAARLPIYFSARDALIAEAPAETAVRFEDAERLHLGGLLWPEAAGRVAKTAYMVREGQGRGQVILFASDPAFRGSAFATQRLLLNAVIYGPGLGTNWASPW